MWPAAAPQPRGAPVVAGCPPAGGRLPEVLTCYRPMPQGVGGSGRQLQMSSCSEGIYTQAQAGKHLPVIVPPVRIFYVAQCGVGPGRAPTLLAVGQCADDIAQSRQGQVDLGGLLEAVPRGAALGHPLAARQVHQVQLPHRVLRLHPPPSLLQCCALLTHDARGRELV